MSTAERPGRITVPPLVEGQRLDQAEFHRRYEAMPPGTRAELIDGVVFMPSPAGPEHGRAHVPALVWLNYYERAGVLEYVVRALEPDEVLWHVLREGRLVAVPPEADGLHRSHVFPGLWLDPQALVARDTRRLRAVLDQGRATPEHAAFVAKLAAARGAARLG